MNNKKVMLGMSGGVDSSAAAVILKENGYDVLGATLVLHESANQKDCADAKAICDDLSIGHKVYDMKKEFRQYVTDDFINQYISGNTPNPCIECNKHIKFGKMLEAAAGEDCAYIATGHYARIVNKDGRYLLLKAKDENKDQSYVLYCLTQAQLSKCIFPLGDFSKDEIREIARKNGFINSERKDSQDICFVPDGKYADFIEQNSQYKSKKGDYVDKSGVKLGEHSGIINYTIGQRRGLGIALGKYMYVLSKDAESGEVVLGDEQDLYYKRVLVGEVNFISFDTLTEPIRVKAKLRYRHKEQPATLYPDKAGVIIEFDEPQRAPSPMQSAVFYDGDIVVGGGKIIGGIEG